MFRAMQVWKLEASANQEHFGCRWDYALAETADDALAICVAKSGLPFNFVHEKPAAMLWPGGPGERVSW